MESNDTQPFVRQLDESDYIIYWKGEIFRQMNRIRSLMSQNDLMNSNTDRAEAQLSHLIRSDNATSDD